MDEAASVGIHHAPDQPAELPVAAKSHVLEHPDGDEGIALAARLTVVILDEFDAIGKIRAGRHLPRIDDLLVRKIEGANANAVARRHMQRQRTPAATGFDDALARLQAQLS